MAPCAAPEHCLRSTMHKVASPVRSRAPHIRISVASPQLVLGAPLKQCARAEHHTMLGRWQRPWVRVSRPSIRRGHGSASQREHSEGARPQQPQPHRADLAKQNSTRRNCLHRMCASLWASAGRPQIRGRIFMLFTFILGRVCRHMSCLGTHKDWLPVTQSVRAW